MSPVFKVCPACHGRGVLARSSGGNVQCATCRGRGTFEQEEICEEDLPKVEAESDLSPPPSDQVKQEKPFWPQDIIDFSLLQDALSGNRGEDQKRIATEGLGVVAILLRKNRDYGSSVFKVPRLAPKVPLGSAILVRMADKVERIEQLQKAEAEVKSESLNDSIRDLAGYSILYLARPKDETQ